MGGESGDCSNKGDEEEEEEEEMLEGEEEEEEEEAGKAAADEERRRMIERARRDLFGMDPQERAAGRCELYCVIPYLLC